MVFPDFQKKKVLAPLLFLSPSGAARCIINAGVLDRSREEGGSFENGGYYHLMELAHTSAVAVSVTTPPTSCMCHVPCWNDVLEIYGLLV